MKTLHISKSLSLPIDVVTMAIAILAQRGAGKSYAASCFAEEMLDAEQQIIVIDPTGAWWGLKASADGKREAYPIPVFGGDHKDIPLEPGSGRVVAQAIVEGKFSAIIDLDDFSNAERDRFMADFLETLYQKNREAVHLFIDEVDSIAPQRPMPGEMRMLGAMEAIVRRGRKKGIGCTMITQRPAVVNKNVLTQAELLIAMRLSHPKDIDPIREWAGVHGDMDTLKKMQADLPSLETGEAWFWSPQALKIFEKVKIRPRNTFDSGATPKPGQAIQQPKHLAKMDIEKLGASIRETIEREKQDDPKLLKAELAKLRSELDKRPDPKVDQIELDASYRLGFAASEEQAQKLLNRIHEAAAGICSIAGAEFKQLPQPKFVPTPIAASRPPPVHPVVCAGNGSNMGRCERAILTVLAQYPHGRRRTQIAILSGYSVTSGGYASSLSKCSSSGWIKTVGDTKRITADGQAALGVYEPLPTGSALLVKWLSDLGKCEAAILTVLADVFPKTLTRTEVAERSGYSPSSGGYANSLSRLRTLELISGSGDLMASPDLF